MTPPELSTDANVAATKLSAFHQLRAYELDVDAVFGQHLSGYPPVRIRRIYDDWLRVRRNGDASLRSTINCPTLVAAVEDLHSHSVYKPDYIARLLSDCGLPAVLSDDLTAVLVGNYRLESFQPEWGDPGISALTVLDFAYRLILQTEPRSNMIGRGYRFRDVLGKLKGDVGGSD